MSTKTERVSVNLTLGERLQLVTQIMARETGGADAAMRTKRIMRCCGLSRKHLPGGGGYYEPMDPGEIKRSGFKVERDEKTEEITGVHLDDEYVAKSRCKFTAEDHKWLVDRLGEYEMPVRLIGWTGVLEGFGLLKDEQLDDLEGPSLVEDESDADAKTLVADHRASDPAPDEKTADAKPALAKVD